MVLPDDAADAVREMDDEEIRAEFGDLLRLCRDADGRVYVTADVDDGDLRTGWSASKFGDADGTVPADSFMSYTELQLRLTGDY